LEDVVSEDELGLKEAVEQDGQDGLQQVVARYLEETDDDGTQETVEDEAGVGRRAMETI
jgi:hypothetical protein